MKIKWSGLPITSSGQFSSVRFWAALSGFGFTGDNAMNWYCFLNRWAWQLGLTRDIVGHYFNGTYKGGAVCVRCGFVWPSLPSKSEPEASQ